MYDKTISISHNAEVILEELDTTGVPLTSKYFAEVFKMRGHEVRVAVSELRSKGFLVCSSRGGYWLATNVEDIDRTIAHLKSRRDKIDKALNGLRGNRHNVGGQ